MVFSKKILTGFIIVAVLGVVVYFFFFRAKSEEPLEKVSEDSAGETRKVEDAPLPVRVVPAKRGELVIKLKSIGEAVTKRNIIMKTEVDGSIKKLNVWESRHVRKGDILVELDDEKYQLSLKRAEAERLRVLSDFLFEKKFDQSTKASSSSDKTKVQKAKEELEKAKQLYEKGLISKTKFDETFKMYEMALIEAGEKKEEIVAARKQLTQMEASLKEAELNLKKTKIRAPFSGIVCDIQVSPDQHIGTGTELFTLVNISTIQVQAKILESEVGKIEVGRNAELIFSAYPDRIFKGKVRAVSPIVNPEDKTCKVTIDVPNPKEEIKPGMHAEVRVAAEVHTDKLLVPQEAVLPREGRRLVFVVDNGLAKWRFVDIGLESEDYAEILESRKEGEGVKEGELVIVEGHFTLAHDARVKIIKESK
jgi:RND family efflux transporter MFP subunit